MSNLDRTKRNILTSIISQIIIIALGLIIPRLTMVGYGSEVNGLLSSITQFIAYLLLLEAGIQAVATQSLYKTVGNKDNKGTNEILSAVNKSYKKIGFYYLLALIVLSLVYPFFAKCQTVNYISVVLIVFFSGLGNVIAFFLQGKYKMLLTVEGKSYLLTTVNTTISILSHVVKIVMLILKLDVVLIIIATFIVSCIQVVVIWLYIKKNYKWIDLSEKPNFSALNQNKHALIHQISSLVFTNTDVLLLTIFCDLKIVSVYTIYKFVISNITSFAIIPLDSCNFALGQMYNTSKDKFCKSIDTLEVYYSGLVFTLFTIVLYLYLPFLKLYTKGVEDINYVDFYIALLFVLQEILTFARYPMLRVISYAGHFKQTLSRTIIETIINLVVSIIMVLKFGIYGVLIGTIVALLYRTIDIIVYSNKKLLNRSPNKTISIYLVNLVLTAICSLILFSINVTINSYLTFIVVGFLSTLSVFIVFMIVLSVLYNKEFKNMFSLIKSFLYKKKKNI